jgi:hypothetical protein
MTEPSLALQTAIRTRLIGSPAVTDLVPSNRVIDGPTRPERFPSIILGDAQTVQAGRAGSWRHVWVYLNIHVWALEGGTEAVRTIANEIDRALVAPLDVPGFQLIPGNFTVTDNRFMRDPSGLHSHGVMAVAALLGEFF